MYNLIKYKQMKENPTIGDLAEEVNRQYSLSMSNHRREFKKGEKSKIFLSIIENLFYVYGKGLGYQNIHVFKADIQFCRNNKNVNINLPEERKNIAKPLYRYENKISEGYTTLTSWQIKEFGLNPDSY